MRLSPQQHTALWLYGSNMDIQQVADQMDISRPTAKEHLHRAYKNLGTSNVRHAIKIAYERGIFVPNQLRSTVQLIAELRRRIDAQQAVIDKAVSGMETRVAVPETVIDALQDVAFQLLRRAGMTESLGSPAQDLRAMAARLDATLRELGSPRAESPLDGAVRGLETVGLFGINRVFLGVVLEDHPEIKHAADESDWSEPEVRDKIAKHVVCDMLGLSHTQYEQAIYSDQSRDALMKDFWAAHQKWT